MRRPEKFPNGNTTVVEASASAAFSIFSPAGGDGNSAITEISVVATPDPAGGRSL